VTYNKLNTYQWFKENTYYLDSSHDPHESDGGLQKGVGSGKVTPWHLPPQPKPTFEEKLSLYQESKNPLYKRSPDLKKLSDGLIQKGEFKAASLS